MQHQAEAPKLIGEIEEETVLLPFYIAQTAIADATEQLQGNVRDYDPDAINALLCKRAQFLYEIGRRFYVGVRAATGRAYLRAFMTHWAVSLLDPEPKGRTLWEVS